jgi:TonB-linked SusC/RagA family outer membrane protein
MRNIISKYLLIAFCCFVATFSAHANKMLEGKVTDANGIPLTGVIIGVKGESNRVLSDAEGNFSISTFNSTTLEFNFPGYETTVAAIQDEDVVVMEKDTDFEYVAFGKQAKNNVTASVFSISGDELLQSRSTNLMVALQGRLPGLSIIQNSGEPGREAFTSRIRGNDSPNGNGIMFVVDGVERDASSIEIHEIERVSILKDAAATAMYGMRGSGGVIMVTTKQGFSGKSKISVTVDYALQAPTRLPSMVNAYDYANMYNQRVANDTLFADAQDIAAGGMGLNQSGTVFYTPYELERYQTGDNQMYYPTRNMMDDFMKEYSTLTRANVNFQGGSDVMHYFTSVGFQHQGGLFEHEKFDKYSYDSESKSKRFNFRTNLKMKVNPTLQMWVQIGGYMEKVNGPHVGNNQGWDYVLAKLYETPNNAHNDLTEEGEVMVKRDKLNFRNTQSVYGYLNRTGSFNETVTRLGNTFGAEQKLDFITEGLKASAQLAFDISSSSNVIRSRSKEAWEVATLTDVLGIDSMAIVKVPGTSNTTLSDDHAKNFGYMYNFRAWLDYQRTFNEKHSVTGFLMAERHMRQAQSLTATNYLGVSGRLAYAYNNKYFAEANFAYQGTEQYAPGKRFGMFPSISAAWLASNENFLKDSEAITYLKLKASVGQTGLSGFPYGSANQYLFLSSWDWNATENQIGNPNIRWETSTKYNVGIEAELFNSFYLGADLFYHNNTDVIVKDISIIPDGMMGLSGASLPPGNVGETKNKGFEVYAGYNKAINKDLSISINGNVSAYKNEIIYMVEMAYDDTYAFPYRQQGYPIGGYWGYESDGLFNTQAEVEGWADQSTLGGTPIPGDIKYVDKTGDNVVDEKDRAFLGNNSQPRCVFGLNAKVTWKWFDLSAFLNGATGRNINLSGFGYWSNRDNFTENMKNAWTPDKYAAGEDILHPRLGNNTPNYRVSNYWLNDGSYIRLRNVELGITLPESVCKAIKAESIRFYANGLNLAVWDKLPNKDFDPEATGSGNLGYPMFKAINFGVSVKF